MTRSPRVLTVGLAVLDRIFVVDELLRGAGKRPAASYSEELGGIAAIGAVTVARLGGCARLLARVGDDPAGETLAAILAEEGVELGLLEVLAGCVSSSSAVCVDASGERQLVNYLQPELLAGCPRLRPNDAGVLDDVAAVMLDTRWPAAALEIATAARERGLPVVLDYERAPARHAAELLACTSHTVFSADGLRTLIADVSDPRDALPLAARHCGGHVAVTLGEGGVLWLDEAGSVDHLPAFSLQVVDTLGAGDVFHGALAFALGAGDELRAALRFASAAAGLKCRARGARAGIPSLAEVEALLVH